LARIDDRIRLGENYSEDQVYAVAKNLARLLVNETHDFIDNL